jgi:hypothetical protein
MAHLFVADTNLFFECHRLEDIQWADLAVDEIVIGLVRPVLGEIDKHKKAGGRTRKRAVEMSGRLREMLEAETQDAQISKAGPSAVLRLLSLAKPAPSLADELDYSINDHQIIGIVAALIDEGAYASVSLLTDDAMAASTAQALGLSVHLIPGTWKRQPQETDEAKKIKDLEKDLATYRAQEPVLDISEDTENASLKHVVRRVALPLAPNEIEKLIDELKARHPETTDFMVPASETLPDGTEVSFTPPDPDTVQKYASQEYPGWVEACRRVLTSLHEGRTEAEPRLSLSFVLKNTGTRPATKTRVTFEALGDIQICRGLLDPDDEEGQSAASKSSGASSQSLPAPPRAPTPTRHVKKPPTNVTTQTGGDRILPPAVLSALQSGALTNAMRALGAQSDLQKLIGPNLTGILGNDTLAELRRGALWSERLGVAPGISSFSYQPEILSSTPEWFEPEAHDPEAFYFDDWPKSQPVKGGGLTCDLFRHGRTMAFNEIDLVFPANGDVSASVRCTVEAENLTVPSQCTIRVSRTVESYSLLQIALEMVDKCGR